MKLKTRQRQLRSLLVCGILFLQHGFLSAQSLQLTTLTEKDGLSSNEQWSTNAICEDSFGFIWYATLGGINRYDGYKISSYQGLFGDKKDLPYNRITAIAEVEDGNLLLGTEEEGLIYFDRKKEEFKPFRTILVNKDSLVLGQINAIRKRGESLVVATAFQGIFEYSLASKTFEEVIVNHPKFKPISTNNLIVLRNNKLAIVSNNGVFVEQAANRYKHYEVTKSYYLKYMVELKNGDLLVRAHNTPVDLLLDKSSEQYEIFKSDKKSTSCAGVYDSDGNLWLSYANGGLFKKTEDIEKHYQVGIDRNGVYFPVCMQDMVATSDGRVHYVSNTGVGSFQESKGLVKPFLEDEIKVFHEFNGTLYYTSRNSIFRLVDGQKERVLSLPKPFEKDEIYNFHQDFKGRFWVGHKGDIGKATIFDKGGNQLASTYTSALSPQYLELKEDSLFTIGNQVYREAEKNKPYKFIGEVLEAYTGERYPDYRVKYYTQLRNGEIWLCTFSQGIYILNRKKKAVIQLQVDPLGNGKLKSDNPYYIFEHSSGLVFISTERGIHLWDPKSKSFTYINERIENVGRRIKGMGEDAKGNLWILNKESLRSFNIATGELREFELGETVFIDYEEPRDLLLRENGDILIQGYNRIYTFTPGTLSSQPAPKKVLVTDIFIARKKLYPSVNNDAYNQSVLYQQEFSFPYTNRNIGFAFVSIGGSSKGVSYFYRLLGESEEWIETKEEREIHYSNLKPGDYAFEVKARAGNGRWTPQASQVKFTIVPPWYLSWYAFVLYAFVAVAIIYAIYRVRINQLLKYQALRIKVSSDLHDDVGSLLTGISMKAQILGIGKKGKEKESLSNLSELSHKAMDSMRDIVWALDARKDSIEDLKQRMLTYAHDNLSIKEIKYDIDFKSYAGLKAINPEQRQNLYYIFKEAITNILKHSNADFVKVKLQKGPLGSKLTIQDNGDCAEDFSKSGQGLSNIKMRAERLGGVAHFDTANGFKVEVRF